MTDAISNLTFINDTGAFETQVHNLGIIQQYGVQFTGTFTLGIATVNPYLKIFYLGTLGNSLATQYGVENRNKVAFESGLSTILTFKHDISVSFVFQYASPENNIQGNSYCDALYFLSLEKTFKQKIKIGLVCALPFSRSFTYQGSAVDGFNFSSHYEGNVKLSNPFCWLKLSYQFSSGKVIAGKRSTAPRKRLTMLRKKDFNVFRFTSPILFLHLSNDSNVFSKL